MTENTSRRRFLKATAATGALAGLNAAVLAQGQQNEEVILLGGKTVGWQGFRLPAQEATGSKNPTMTLQAGTTYTLMWENLDGVGHNFAIQDSKGNNLKVLEPLTVQSDTFSRINNTTENQTVSLQISDGNVTNVTIANETGNMTGGNVTGGNQTTTKLESLVAQTQILSDQGAVQGVRFTASEEMAQYICLVHPNTMVGSIEMAGGGGGAANNSSG